MGLSRRNRGGARLGSQGARRARQDANVDVSLKRRDDRLDGHDANLFEHGGRLNGHDNKIGAHDAKFSLHDDALSSHGGRLDAHATEIGESKTRLNGHDATLGNHDTKFGLHDTALDNQSARITTAQDKANAADANAESRVPKSGYSANQWRGSVPNGVWTGFEMAANTVGDAQINDNVRNRAATFISMRSMDGRAGSAAPYCMTPFMHLPKAERVRRVAVRDALAASDPETPEGRACLKEGVLLALSMLMDYAGETNPSGEGPMTAGEREAWLESGGMEATDYGVTVGAPEFRGLAEMIAEGDERAAEEEARAAANEKGAAHTAP